MNMFNKSWILALPLLLIYSSSYGQVRSAPKSGSVQKPVSSSWESPSVPHFVLRSPGDMKVLLQNLQGFPEEVRQRVVETVRPMLKHKRHPVMAVISPRTEIAAFFPIQDKEKGKATLLSLRGNWVQQGPARRMLWMFQSQLPRISGSDLMANWVVMHRLFDQRLLESTDAVIIHEKIKTRQGIVVGTQEATFLRSEIRVWDFQRRLVNRIPIPGGYYHYAVFPHLMDKNKGRVLIQLWPYDNNKAHLGVVDFRTGKITIYPHDTKHLYLGLEALPFSGGNKIIFVNEGWDLKTKRPQIGLYDIRTGNLRRTPIRRPLDRPFAKAVSSDGRYLGVVEGSGDSVSLVVVDVKSGKILGNLRLPRIDEIKFSKDGKEIFYSDTGGAIHIWPWYKEKISNENV